jgi:ethanolamine transporter EutH
VVAVVVITLPLLEKLVVAAAALLLELAEMALLTITVQRAAETQAMGVMVATAPAALGQLAVVAGVAPQKVLPVLVERLVGAAAAVAVLDTTKTPSPLVGCRS